MPKEKGSGGSDRGVFKVRGSSGGGKWRGWEKPSGLLARDEPREKAPKNRGNREDRRGGGGGGGRRRNRE